ncbi:MAG: MFS transporter [Cyanobacteria bacterium P01_D01_bin.50]
MSSKDVSKNDRNDKTSMSEILKTDMNKNWEHSHNSSNNNLNENLQAATVTFADKSDLPIEKKNKSQVSINTKEQGFLPVLKNPNFLALWGGQVFCQLADKVYLVLMIALINTQFQSEGSSISTWVSALMMTFTIPAVLFGSLAGVFVDRWVKKTVLVSTNIWRGILVLAIAPLFWLANDWQDVGNIPAGFLIILGITFLVSTLTQFFAPAEQAVIPLIVKPHNLLSANSLYTTTMMASVIVGFAIGEPLLSAADALWLQFGGSSDIGKQILVGGSYAIAGLILLLLTTNEKPQAKEKESNHVLSDLKDGLVYLGQNNRLRNALIQLIVLFSVLAALTVLAVRVAEIIPSIKAEQFGFLLASGGVGIALGAMVLGQFGQHFSTSRLSLTGCMGMVISLSGLAIFTQQLWFVLFFIGFLGVSGALVGIPLQTAIQTETPAQMRGKVFGLQNNLVNIALTLPLALAGIAENFFGLQTVFLTLAAIVFCAAILTGYKSA